MNRFASSILATELRSAPRRLLVDSQLLLCLFLLTGGEARAYVDPGSGAAYYQILLIGAVGLLFRIRKILGWLRSRLTPVKPADRVVENRDLSGTNLGQSGEAQPRDERAGG